MRAAWRTGILAAILAALCSTPPVAAQDVGARELPQAGPDLRWANELSDVPLVDLSGVWEFIEESSDPMVEVWRGREIHYEISQQNDRVVMNFVPENGEPNVQEYRWDGTVNAFLRGTAEVRERARWRDNGRTLEIEGRWWPADDRSQVFSYSFIYTVDSNRRLLFRQVDEYGETAWRFRR